MIQQLKDKEPNLKNRKDLRRHFSKEETQDGQKIHEDVQFH